MNRRHSQQQLQPSSPSKCLVVPSQMLGPNIVHCRECPSSLAAHQMAIPSSSPNGHHSHSHSHHLPPSSAAADSSFLLCSSAGSVSAYAALNSSSLLRPPPPPNFPPPQRRREQQRRPKVGERRSNRKCSCACLWLGIFLLFAGAIAISLFFWLILFRPESTEDVHLHLHHPNSLQQNVPSFSSIHFSSKSLDNLPLNEPIHFHLPGHHILFSQLHVLHDSLLWLNFTLLPSTRIVLFARHTLPPSPGQFDWQQILSGQKLHQSGIDGSSGSRSRKSSHRMAVISHFMQTGKWHLAFFNDRQEAESISLLAKLEEDEESNSRRSTEAACRFDCFGKGQCREGKCACHPGYGGPFCEETVCPVLCSGQGIFDGGQCHCYEGFRGAECELATVAGGGGGGCSADSKGCSGHGECQSDGKCTCHSGWKGENCGRKECPGGRECAPNGVCIEGKCFCEFGWTGRDCGQQIGEEKGMEDNEQKWKVEEENTAGMCPFGCPEHGECKQNGECQCAAGWTGQNCQIEFCHKNCSSYGQCVLGVNGKWECQCQNGHFGEYCQFGWESDCQDGMDNDSDGLTDCEDSTECCSHSECSSDPVCLGSILSKELLLNRNAILSTTGSSSSSSFANSSFADRFHFLFDGGPLSVQKYADTRLLQSKRLSILRGLILSKKGGPLIGVRISDANNPQQGFSLTRTDPQSMGQFELAVNGGAVVSLQFVRQPYGRLVRSFFVPPNQILDIGPIWMDQQQQQPSPSTSSSSSSIDAIPSAGCLHSIGQLHFRPTISVPPHFLPSPSSQKNIQLSLNSRIVSLSIPIHHGHSLFYSSQRANVNGLQFGIQILPQRTPAQLLVVHLEVQIGGRIIQQKMSPKSNLTYQFNWKRQNAFWQEDFGAMARAQVSIGFQFANCVPIIWQYFHIQLPSTSPPSHLPSLLPTSPQWSINSVHRLHPQLGLLEKGNGQLVFLNDRQFSTPILRRIFEGRKDGNANQFTALIAAPDGSAFLGESSSVLRLSADGHKVDKILQIDPMDSSHPYFLAIHPSNSALFISLPLRKEIWKLPIEEEMGSEKGHLVFSDANKGLTFPKGIAFDIEGNLLVADGRRLVQLDEDGTIGKVLIGGDEDGRRPWRPLKDCAKTALLKEFRLEWPIAMALDPTSGQLFLLDSSSAIFRLDFRVGIVSLIAGSQRSCENGDDGAIEAIAFCPLHGTLYMLQRNGKGKGHLVRMLESAANYPPGEPKILLGQKFGDDVQERKDEEENVVIASKARITNPMALAILPNGDLLIADEAKLNRMEWPIGMEYDEGRRVFRVNGQDGREQYEFDQQMGKHLRTIDIDNIGIGETKQHMEYNDENGEEEGGLLKKIKENDGRELRIIRRRKRREWEIVDESGKQLVKAEMEGNGQMIKKIILPSSHLSNHPIIFAYKNNINQLLASVQIGNEMTMLDYEEENGFAKWAKLPGGEELMLDGPDLKENGKWMTKVRKRKNDREDWGKAEDIEQDIASTIGLA